MQTRLACGRVPVNPGFRALARDPHRCSNMRLRPSRTSTFDDEQSAMKCGARITVGHENLRSGDGPSTGRTSTGGSLCINPTRRYQRPDRVHLGGVLGVATVVRLPRGARVVSMLTAARCQVNISARCLAQARRCPSGRLTIARTASAMAAGLLSARAPLSEVMISPAPTCGRPPPACRRPATPARPARRFRAAPARARRRLRPAARRRCAVGDEAGEINRQSRGLPLQSGPQRAVAHDDESGLDAGVAQCGDRVDAAIGALFQRQPATVHQQDLVGRGPTPAHRAERRDGWNISRSTPSGTVTVFVAPMRSNSSRANPVVHTTVS